VDAHNGAYRDRHPYTDGDKVAHRDENPSGGASAAD
jgi:hypothetical protein